MSLLDKLKSEDSEDQKKRGGRAVARRVVARTGRFAVAAETWFRLRNQLAKRFYVASTSSGSKIAASSGERSIGVLSTQIEVVGKEVSWTRNQRTVAAVVRDRKEITTQPVSGLPGIIASVELIQDGDVVLAGTEDGRLIARSCANLQDWDIYAQDLFAYQDEHRPATKIADSAVVVVRAIGNERLLTVSENGVCQVWKTSDVVHAPISPLEMTEQQVRSPESPLLTASPLYILELPVSRVLGLTISASDSLGAVITSDEQITIFDTRDGQLIESISAAQLDDTQPVSVLIEETQMRVLVGLADGRIFRRAINDTNPVTGSNHDGNDVDYETVFAPDTHDRAGAITAMEARHDGSLLYIGRLNGFVTQFDLPRKRLHRSEKLHTGPVIEIRSTEAGVFTIGDDRVAKLSDVPNPPQRGTAIETFRLPVDGPLKEKHLIEPDEKLSKDKFTVRRNFDGAVTNASQREVRLVGIRPADPVLALYQHQLRVNSDQKERSDIRRKIVGLQPTHAPVSESRDESETSPIHVAEMDTEFDFQSLPLRRVVMSLSDDGTTLAAAQYFKSGLVRSRDPDQAIVVWDTETETKLRTWRRLNGVRDLNLDLDSGLLLPKPSAARLHLFRGDLVTDERQSISSQKYCRGNLLALGLAGRSGAVTNVLELWRLDSRAMLSSLEAFEGIVPAVAWSSDGSTLFASVRDHSQSRLLELDGQTLRIRSEVDVESIDGQWDVERVDLARGALGATHILPSPSGNQLVTYGKYTDTAAPYQLRIRKKSGDRWPSDQIIVVDAKEPILEPEMAPVPMVFVDQQETFLAVIGTKGVGVINLRTGEIGQNLEIPDVGNRRPVSLLSPDGKWLFVGDKEGSVWVASLRSLQRKPMKFAAQAGPVTGLAISTNTRFGDGR